MQLLRQSDAQPYEIVRLLENPLRHLTHCLSFLCVLTKIWCVKYAVTPLNGNAASDIVRRLSTMLAIVAPLLGVQSNVTSPSVSPLTYIKNHRPKPAIYDCLIQQLALQHGLKYSNID